MSTPSSSSSSSLSVTRKAQLKMLMKQASPTTQTSTQPSSSPSSHSNFSLPIQSPLAQYTQKGTLHCILCKTKVKSNLWWTSHCASTEHKQRLVLLANKKTLLDQVQLNPSQPGMANPPPTKKSRTISDDILSNSTTITSDHAHLSTNPQCEKPASLPLVQDSDGDDEGLEDECDKIIKSIQDEWDQMDAIVKQEKDSLEKEDMFNNQSRTKDRFNEDREKKSIDNFQPHVMKRSEFQIESSDEFEDEYEDSIERESEDETRRNNRVRIDTIRHYLEERVERLQTSGEQLRYDMVSPSAPNLDQDESEDESDLYNWRAKVV